jgi:NAD(P)H-nitrite reductase large subunit
MCLLKVASGVWCGVCGCVAGVLRGHGVADTREGVHDNGLGGVKHSWEASVSCGRCAAYIRTVTTSLLPTLDTPPAGC